MPERRLNDKVPSVRNNKRRRVGMRRADVDKVDPQTIDFGLELRKAIEERLS
jgi:hypothetical protein